MSKDLNKLGDLKSSERLIRDLYIDLRTKVNYWASKTKQTAQARMGYVGQHLVSVVTGYPGGKSGGRGKDLILDGNNYAEIKTCYRVDQLGKCLNCNAVVASIEPKCVHCNSENIKRKQDSKWLLSIRNENDFAKILEPKFYYLVLFDLQDLDNPNKIRASIWRVDPSTIGFSYCLIDYYLNIRSKSKSKAPFNLWPFQLKFYLMLPMLVYRSYILNDDVKTEIFYEKDHVLELPKPFSSYLNSSNLTKDKILIFAKNINFKSNENLATFSKKKLVSQVDTFIKNNGGFDREKVKKLARSLYYDNIKNHVEKIPESLKQVIHT